MTCHCPRTLDKPILLMGLEMEDLGLLCLIIGLLSLFMGPLLPGAGGLVGWFALARFKRGKPAGYLLHRLYALGFDLPGLLPPLSKAGKYAVFSRDR